MRPHPALLVALLSLLALGVAAGTGGAHQGPPASVETVAADRTTNGSHLNGTTISLTPQRDGDVRWNVTTRFSLDTANETAAFDRLRRDFEQGRSDAGYSVDAFRSAAELAQQETGREMEIRSVERTAGTGNGTGRLSLTFVWTNFSRTPDSQIVIHDAFLLDGGNSTWLWELQDDQRLVIRRPDGYQFMSSNGGPEVRAGTVYYDGPTTFAPGEIDVTYERDAGPVGPDGFELASLPGIVGLLLVVGVGGAGVYVLAQRRTDDETTDAPPVTEDVPPTPEPAPEPDDADERDLELLSDEERVERLLRENGGRMKQADIVTETNWSNAKVSQLLSAMHEEDRVDKLRIGRENLITLPDEDVTDFDDE